MLKIHFAVDRKQNHELAAWVSAQIEYHLPFLDKPSPPTLSERVGS